MDAIERKKMLLLNREIMAETDHARLKFPIDKSVEALPLVYGMNALVEEIGKLSRCWNKLTVASDEDVRQSWRVEARHRIITNLSLLERIFIQAEKRSE